MKRAAHDNIGIGKPNVRASNPDLPLRQTSDRLPGADFNKRFLDRHSKVKQVQTMQERMDKYRRFLEELEDGLEDGGIEDGTEVNWNSYLRGMMQKMMKTMLFKEQQLEKLKK